MGFDGTERGLGAKFQRAISSEIMAYDVSLGVKTGSRIDPLGIERSAARIYQAADPDEGWVIDPAEARMDNGKPVVYAGKGQGEKGRPSMINHGNVTPSIDARAGGIRASRIEQVAVMSFAALRRLRFPLAASGEHLGGDARARAEIAARTAVAALGVAALAYHYELDFDLRSRCLLVPKHAPRIELLGRDGSDPIEVSTDRQAAARMLDEAARFAADAGLPWMPEDLKLVPSPKLIELVKRSRRIVAEEPGAE